MTDPAVTIAQVAQDYFDMARREGYVLEGAHVSGLADAVIEALAQHGIALVPQQRYEYSLGYQTENGTWIELSGRYSHPWLSEVQKQLSEYAGDPDWDGVEVIGRPIAAWMPAARVAEQTPSDAKAAADELTAETERLGLYGRTPSEDKQ